MKVVTRLFELMLIGSSELISGWSVDDTELRPYSILNFGMDLENEKNRVGIWDYQLIASEMAV